MGHRRDSLHSGPVGLLITEVSPVAAKIIASEGTLVFLRSWSSSLPSLHLHPAEALIDCAWAMPTWMLLLLPLP